MADATKYADLKREYEAERIPYGKLLSCEEWQSRREEIIDRDEGHCTSCGKPPTTYLGGQHLEKESIEPPDEPEVREIEITAGTKSKTIQVRLASPTAVYTSVDQPRYLHVHHEYYVLDWLPWNYPGESLVTLCNKCHNRIHRKESIPVYETEPVEEELIEMTPCRRCNGEGYLPQYEHVKGGVCFRCNGRLFEDFVEDDV